MYIGVEVRGGEEPWSDGLFHLYKLNTARRSHLKPSFLFEACLSSGYHKYVVANSMAKLSSQCVDWSTPITVIWRPPEHLSMSDRIEKQAPGKADQWIIDNDTHMDH